MLNISITSTTSTSTGGYIQGTSAATTSSSWTTWSGTTLGTNPMNYQSPGTSLNELIRLEFLVKRASEDLEGPTAQITVSKVREDVYVITEAYVEATRTYSVNKYGINGPFAFTGRDGTLEGTLINGKMSGLIKLKKYDDSGYTLTAIFNKGSELPQSGFRYSAPERNIEPPEENLHTRWWGDGFKHLDLVISDQLAVGEYHTFNWKTVTLSNNGCFGLSGAPIIGTFTDAATSS